MPSQSKQLTANVAAGGTATITVQPYGGRPWNVTQVSVELPTAPVGATCSLRKNGYLVTPLIPTGDAAAGDPPVLLLPEDLMTIEWAGCTPGTLAKALILYDVM